MELKSIWKVNAPAITFNKLTSDIHVDVAIIGGGITGITAAHLLSEKGYRVAVLEAYTIAGGTTGFSTGNLYNLVDEQFQNIKSKHNVDTMKNVCYARGLGIDLIQQFIERYKIDCDFKRVPFYLIAEGSAKSQVVKDEAGYAKDCGLLVTETTKSPMPFPVHTVMQVENQAQLNPYAYTLSLAKAIQSDTCMLYEHTKVEDIKEEKDRVELKTSGGFVTAKHVIMATHTPKGVYMVQTLLGSYREYAIAMKLNEDTYPKGIFWMIDEENRHSLRTYEMNGEKYLMVLGEKHKTGQKTDNQECFQNLEKYARDRFNVKAVSYRWAAQHYRPADGLPFIGRSAGDSNVYFATGYSTDGLIYGTVAAMTLAAQIDGKEENWHKVFDPARVNPLASAKQFIKENVNVAMQYLKDIPFKAETEHFKDIAVGEGKTIEIDNEKYAAYRNEYGEMKVVSAICPHMKCVVNWNSSEKSWDCPCHGSRFSCEGKVIEGPAIQDLQQLNLKK